MIKINIYRKLSTLSWLLIKNVHEIIKLKPQLLMPGLWQFYTFEGRKTVWGKKKKIASEAISKLSWLGKNGRGKPSHLHLWTPKPVHSKTSDSPGLGWMPSGTQYSNLFSRCLHWAGCEDLTVVWSYSYCVDGKSREAN